MSSVCIKVGRNLTALESETRDEMQRQKVFCTEL
jgi:hypothetical protein